MSLARTFLSEEKRNAIRQNFFSQEKVRREALEDECKVDGMVLVSSAVYAPCAYLFLTGLCTSSLLFLPPIVLGYYGGNKLGTSIANCLFKENTNPTDDQLLAFEEQRKYSLS